MPNQKTETASVRDRLLSALLYPLPHHWISRVILFFTRRQTNLKNPFIRWFIQQFNVDMSESVYSRPEDFIHFNAFFTRKLKPELRPIASGDKVIVSPVDGTISQAGSIESGTILQAKGRNFSTLELIGGDASLANEFADGSFNTVYLSPRDYHRIHMPLSGSLRTMIHIPGRLFSVAPHTVRAVPKLFARNERVVNIFDSEHATFALILVGAINVAAIETVWHGLVTPPHRKRIHRVEYAEQNIMLNQGAEMGRFNMGSTVILLTARNVRWEPQSVSGRQLKFGQKLAEFAPQQAD